MFIGFISLHRIQIGISTTQCENHPEKYHGHDLVPIPSLYLCCQFTSAQIALWSKLLIVPFLVWPSVSRGIPYHGPCQFAHAIQEWHRYSLLASGTLMERP